jgi:hypothetical protein
MAVTKGKDGKFYVGANAVAETRSFRFTETAARADSSTLNDEWDKNETTTKSWSGSAEVWWDPSNVNGQGALKRGDKPTVYLYPAGNTAGKTYRWGIVHVDSVEVGNERDGIVNATIQWTGHDTCNEAVVGA